MYRPLFVHIRGVLPQLMHNGRLKNPLDPWAKEVRKYSSKRKKVDEDHIAMMEAEYKGSLYLYDDDLTKVCDGKVPFWPADNLHALIKTAAKEKRMGKIIDSAMVVTPPGGRLMFDGPRTRYKLWADPAMRHVKGTKRGTMCCRPMFVAGWEVQFTLRFLEDKLNPDDLKRLIEESGKTIGLSDWPRRHGLFDVVEFRDEEVEIDVTK